MISSPRIMAAAYLRTSTLEQPYSMDAQKRVIREYADRYGFEIVQTYVDQGRSGLTLGSRPGLSALLSEIANGQPKYHAVLVYDVSRWGRFQDGDESAHYEFLCKALNVPVHYCAESFLNDGELPNYILKSLKRTMAAEYSRDLSTKCILGLKRFVLMGFKTGGIAGYGLRRLAISADGSPRQLLRPGERKSIATDRIVLVPGPQQEVDVVRKIFSMAAIKHMSYHAIAAELNRRRIPYEDGREWPDYVIHRMLSNRKYIGDNVWNRTTGKLGTTRKRNAPSKWIVVPNAFEPIVARPIFEKAQWAHPKSIRWTHEQLLERAEALQHGRTTSAPGPSLTTLRRRLVGMPYLRSTRGTAPFDPRKGPINTRQRIASARNQVFDTLLRLFPGQITEFQLSGKSRPLLRVSERIPVSVIVCERLPRRTGILRWRFRPLPAEAKFVTLVCLEFPMRMQFYLVPGVTIVRDCSIGMSHPILKTGVRLNSLKQFCDGLTAFYPPRQAFPSFPIL